MPGSVLQVVSDPDFAGLHPEDQQAALSQFDPDFAKLSPTDFSASVTALQKKGISRPDLVAPPSAAKPAEMKEQPLSTKEKVEEKSGRLLENLGETTGVYTPNAKEVIKHNIQHPIADTGTTLKNMLKAQEDTGSLAYKELGKGEYLKGGTDLIEAGIPFLGPGLSKAGHQLENGDIMGGTGTTLGLGAGVASGKFMGDMAPGGPPVEPGYAQASEAMSRSANAAPKPLIGQAVQAVSEKAGNLATKGGIALGKGVSKAAYSTTKNVGIPAIQGSLSAIGDELTELGAGKMDAVKESASGLKDSITEAVTNGKGKLVDRINDALDKAGDAGAALKPKAEEIAQKMTEHLINGGGKLADNVEGVLRDYQELGEDVIGRNFDKIVSKVTDTMSAKAEELGLSKEDIQAKVKNAVNAAKDEYTYHFNRPKSVSGGSGAPDPEELVQRHLEEQFGPSQGNVGPFKSSTWDASKPPIESASGTPLSNLIDNYPEAAALKGRLTSGQTRPGLWGELERLWRRTPVFGRSAAGEQQQQFLNAWDNTVRELAERKDIGANAQDILHRASGYKSSVTDIDPTGTKTQRDVWSPKQGHVDLENLVNSIDAAPPNAFKNFAKNKSPDDSGLMRDLRDAAAQSTKDIDATTKYGTEAANAGMSTRIAMNIVAKLGAKRLAEEMFLNPREWSKASGKLGQLLERVPVKPDMTSKMRTAIGDAEDEGIDYTQTQVYKNMSDTEKLSLDRWSESFLKRLGRTFSGKAREIKPGQTVPPRGREFNTSSLVGVPAIGQQQIQPATIADLKLPRELQELIMGG